MNKMILIDLSKKEYFSLITHRLMKLNPRKIFLINQSHVHYRYKVYYSLTADGMRLSANSKNNAVALINLI